MKILALATSPRRHGNSELLLDTMLDVFRSDEGVSVEKIILTELDLNSIGLEGTDIAKALSEAAKAFVEDDKKGTRTERDTRAVVLVSDGEQIEGKALEAAKDAARMARVYVLGVGTPEGAAVRRPVWMTRQSTPVEMSQAHTSRLDEETLTQIALAGDGRYVRTTPDDFDVRGIVEHMAGLAGRDAKTSFKLNRVNRYRWPLAVALLCFAAEGLWCVAMPWRRRRYARRSAVGEGQYA